MLNKITVKIEELFSKAPDTMYSFCQRHLPDLNYRYLSAGEIVQKYFKNRELKYRTYRLNELRKMKKGDTLFILGSNRSINEMPDAAWEQIGKCDSLGFNYWMFHEFVPTYYGLEYGKNKQISHFHKQLIKSRSSDYRNTIFLVNTRAGRRGMTPRLMPDYFPESPKVAYFLFPKIVNCPEYRPFETEDFKRSIFYRGSLNLYLHFARLMGYKNIILVGCEMNTSTAFYEDWPEAQWIFEQKGYVDPKEERAKMLYGGTYASKQKHGFIETIHAINDLVFKPEGIKLYVFNNKSLLHPEVPLFEF